MSAKQKMSENSLRIAENVRREVATVKPNPCVQGFGLATWRNDEVKESCLGEKPLEHSPFPCRYHLQDGLGIFFLLKVFELSDFLLTQSCAMGTWPAYCAHLSGTRNMKNFVK